MKLIYCTLTSIFLSLSAFAFGISPITGSTNVCINSADTLSNASAGGTWSSTNTAIALINPTTGIVTGLAAGTSTIIYTLGADTSTSVITVNSLPDLYTVTGGGSYCADSVGVHVGLSGSALGISYLLYYGVSVTGYATGTGTSIDFGLLSPPGVYTVLATNITTGCASAMAGSVSVSINPLVAPSVSIILSQGDSICQGSEVTYTATPTNAGSAPTYLWSINGTNVAVGNHYNFIPANGDKVTVTMTANITCASTEMANANVTMAVLPNETPSATLSVYPGDTICQYAEAQFSVQGSSGGYDPVYEWYVNGVNDGTGATFSYLPVTGDAVYCQLTSNYQCRLANTANTGDVTLTVAPLLTPLVSIITNPGFYIGAGSSDTLTAEVTNGGRFPTYQWYVNGVPVTGATSAIFTSNSFTNYDSVTCLVTSSGFCSNITAFSWVYISVAPTGIAQIVNPGSDVQLFPNPNNGSFTVSGSMGAANDEQVAIQITDMLGHIVYRDEVMAVNGIINEQLSQGSDLANGVYLLSLQSAAGNKFFHFVIER